MFNALISEERYNSELEAMNKANGEGADGMQILVGCLLKTVLKMVGKVKNGT